MKHLLAIIKNNSGSISWPILFSVVLVFSLFFIILGFDLIYYEIMNHRFESEIQAVNHETYQLINIRDAAYNVNLEVTDTTTAKQVFIENLARHLNLNSNLQPNPSNHLISGQVAINQFNVVTVGQLPFNNGYGYTMNHPGIITEVDIPVTLPFFKFHGVIKNLVNTEIYR